MFVFFTSSITFYAAYLVCLLQLQPWHLHIFLSWHLHIMNIFTWSQVTFSWTYSCKSLASAKQYNYITNLSTYTPTRSRANHRLVWGVTQPMWWLPNIKLTIPRSPIGCSQCLLQRGFWPWSLMLVNEHIIVNPGAHVICFKYLLNVFICIYIFTYGKNKRNRWTRMQSRKTCLKHFQQSCTFSGVTVPVWSVGRGGLQSLECEDSGDSGV